MRYVSMVIKALLLIYVVLFCVYNSDPMNIVVFPKFAEFTIPLFLPVVAGFLLGGAAAIFIYLGDKYRASKEIKSLRKQLAANTGELEKMHNMPFLDDEKK